MATQLSDFQGSIPNIDHLDFLVCHSPYSRLVEKAHARVALNDFLHHPNKEQHVAFRKLLDIAPEQLHCSKEAERILMEDLHELFVSRVKPSLMLAKELGNTYCSSVYCGLASLVYSLPQERLVRHLFSSLAAYTHLTVAR